MNPLQGSFWIWLAFAFIGLIALRFVPGKAQWALILIVLLGGMFRVSNGPNGWGGFIHDLTGGKLQ